MDGFLVCFSKPFNDWELEEGERFFICSKIRRFFLAMKAINF